MKPLDAVQRGHVDETARTAGYAVLEEQVRQALRREELRLRARGLSERDADCARGFIEACEWMLRLPEDLLARQ